MPDGWLRGASPDFGRHILKLALPEIAKQEHSVVKRDGKVVEPIAIVVAHGAGHGVAACFQAGSRCVQVFKAAVAAIVQHANGLCARLHQHQVHLA